MCAWGRYDGLIAQIGGKPAPACGFAMGIERLLTLLTDAATAVPERVADAYLVHSGEAAEKFAWNVAETLRGKGVSVVFHCGGGSFKAQMKRADASGAPFAVIVGEDEAEKHMVGLKPLRGSGDQLQVSAEEAAGIIRSPDFSTTG